MKTFIVLFGIVLTMSIITIEAESCSSDFNCGLGQVCVKAPFKLEGICMEAVDEFGIKTYPEKSLDSMDIPTEGSCDFDLDCPIGFYCHKKYKVCIKR